jgi:Na+/melibiose symporter-like transporter
MGASRVDGLTPWTIGIYGTGHVLNDLAAACWFNYLLYFLSEVLGIGGSEAGGIMLVG